ncbi:MAG: toll/interleukin-1 receptor domain-containing protein, partial [Chloroflexota bacterium]
MVDRLRRMYDPGDVWYDDGLHGGDLWWEEILDQIAAADIFIYVLSNESVQSDYCQAEFTEARRLQKAIITVQARDRTRLTDRLKDIHYINMTNGVTDGDALTDLYRSIDKQSRNIRRRRPLWAGRTPKPGSVEEKPRPADAPEVETPTLQLPKVEQEAPVIPWWRKPEFIIGAIAVPIVAAVIGGLIQISPTFFQRNTPTPTDTGAAVVQENTPVRAVDEAQIPSEEDARATGAAQAYATLTALAPTNTPTITPTPTETPISSSDIQRTAQAEIFATETSVAGTQAVIAQQTQNVVLTEQFIAGATATYIAVLSLTPPTTNTPPRTDTPEPPTSTFTPRPPTNNNNTLDPVTLALTPVTRNADWTPVERDFDGVTMVLVPVGCFMMGSENGSSKHCSCAGVSSMTPPFS